MVSHDLNQLIIDALRYRWLRGEKKTKGSYCFWPYVIDPVKSRLYAVQDLKNQTLDKSIDESMLHDMAQYIYTEKCVYGDTRFSDPDFKFSDEFSTECEEEAKIALTDIRSILASTIYSSKPS